MSGESPKPPGSPAGPGDPAMDDILASIRRILNEDEAPPGIAPAVSGPMVPPATTPPPAAAEEPLDLTEDMMIQAPTPDEMPEETQAQAEAVAPAVASLVAPTVAAATTAAVGKLLRAVAQERSSPIHRGGPTIEDVVREELRPMIKEWLDQHLPPLVERLVRAEIERVVGRALP